MKKRIVVVEDETDILQLLNMILSRAGYEVYLCDNGRNALDLIRKVRPNLILLDMMLPGMDGKAIVSAMAEEEDIAGIPVIITSALEESEQMFMGNPQIKGFAFKPFKMADLLESVKEVLGE